jgi:peptide/nickel transport system permease protein
VYGYVVRRLISASLVIVITSMTVFALFFYGPSNPGLAMCQQVRSRCTAEQAEGYNEALGVNEPVVGQYVAWAKGVFVGRDFQFGGATYDCPAPCLGISYSTRQPVWDEIKQRYPVSVSLAVGAAAIFLPFGVLLGTIAARRRGSITDKATVGGSLVLTSIPDYVVFLVAFLYLVLYSGVFPSPEYTSFFDNPWSWFTGLLLAWVVMGIYFSTDYARFSRGYMIEALGEDYVRTARAKGVGRSRIVVKHALRATIVPILTIFGLDLAQLLSGTVFVEVIFNYQGLGRLAVDSVREQNFPLIQATVLVAAVLIVLGNLIVDLLYSVIDPRVKLT